MPWISGVYSRLYSWVADAAAGLDISSSRMDADTNDIVGGLNLTLTRDGSTNPTANLPMNGFHHTGAVAATAAGMYLTWDQFAAGNLPPLPALPGDVSIGGTLSVGGLATLSGGANVGGTLTAATINAQAATVAGMVTANAATVAGTVTANAATLASLNGNVLVTGSLNAPTGGGGLPINGGLVVNPPTPGADAIWCNGGLQVNGAMMMDGPITAPAGGGGLPFNTSIVVNATAGQADAIWSNGDIAAVAGAAGDGRVDAAGGYYISGTPHLFADRMFGALFRALADAPEGVRMIVVKQSGQLTAQPA